MANGSLNGETHNAIFMNTPLLMERKDAVPTMLVLRQIAMVLTHRISAAKCGAMLTLAAQLQTYSEPTFQVLLSVIVIQSAVTQPLSLNKTKSSKTVVFKQVLQEEIL